MTSGGCCAGGGHRGGSTEAAARRLRGSLRLLASALEACDAQAAARALDAHVELVVDTGVAGATHTPIRGAGDVAAALVCAVRSVGAGVVAEESVNGMPGLSLRTDGRVVGIVAATARRRRISHVWVVLNPDKLRRWNPAD